MPHTYLAILPGEQVERNCHRGQAFIQSACKDAKGAYILTQVHLQRVSIWIMNYMVTPGRAYLSQYLPQCELDTEPDFTTTTMMSIIAIISNKHPVPDLGLEQWLFPSVSHQTSKNSLEALWAATKR